MTKKVLVIGGSYFVGRVMVILCTRAGDEFELHVVNRGNAPLRKEGVTEYKCDRHNVDAMVEMLPDIKFDAVIDFCAYNAKDISSVINAMADRIGQYIYISTSSVYINDNHKMHVETDPLLFESNDDMVAQYICSKSNLETELIETCALHNIPYTIARPAFIYGPFNYAPRESWYIKKLAHSEPIPVLTDGTAHFNFVYVTDVAEAMMNFVGDKRAYNQAFNLSNSDEIITESIFVKELENQHGRAFEKLPMSVAEALAKSVAIPWPLTDDELVDGTKYAKTFDMKYTSLQEGMRKAYKSFMNVYA